MLPADAGAGIALAPDRLPPPPVCEKPVDSLAQPALEAPLRPPTKLTLGLRGIDRIAAVVAGPVGDKSDEVPIAVTALSRQPDVEQIADAFHDRQIVALGTGADIVALPGLPRLTTSSSAVA